MLVWFSANAGYGLTKKAAIPLWDDEEGVQYTEINQTLSVPDGNAKLIFAFIYASYIFVAL